jgi:hypothetical protein
VTNTTANTTTNTTRRVCAAGKAGYAWKAHTEAKEMKLVPLAESVRALHVASFITCRAFGILFLSCTRWASLVFALGTLESFFKQSGPNAGVQGCHV